MTFEEIHDKIVSGGRPSDQAEIVESLHKLEDYGGKTPQMTALRLSESKRLFDGDAKHWVRWAVGEFGFRSENDTQHKRAVGDMLYDLRDAEFPLFKRFLGTDFSKLYELTEIHINFPLPTLLNFVKLHFADDEIRREDLRLEKDKLLGKTRESAQAAGGGECEQPEFDFATELTSTYLDERKLANGVREPKNAIMLGVNGVALCRAAAQKISDMGGVPLSVVMDLEARLRDAADQLRALAAATADAVQERD